uniref:Uncharacterized protein n=1 Tax=Anguilla anguilla TaxID=7936 RepID=A0A0E9X246_ANGAN
MYGLLVRTLSEPTCLHSFHPQFIWHTPAHFRSHFTPKTSIYDLRRNQGLNASVQDVKMISTLNV